MAIDQSTIDGAGIGNAPPVASPAPAFSPSTSPVASPAPTSPASKMAEQRARQVELSQQLQGTQQEQERLMREKTQALEPVRAQMLEEAKKTPSEPPKEEAIPSFHRPTVDPKEFHDSFGVLMAAAMLVGAASRTPFFGTMNAMTGAMNGFMAGDKNLVDEAMKEYDKNMAAIKERNAAKRREFDDAWNKHKNDLGALRSQLEIIAARYDDPAMLQAAKAKTITDAMKAGDTNLRHMEQMQMQMDRLRVQMEKGSSAIGHNQSAAESDAIESMAWDYLIRGHNPPAAGGAYQKTMARVSDIAKRFGMTPDEIITSSAEVKQMLAGRRTIESRIQNTERAENLLNREIPVMEDAMKAINSPNIPALARGKIAVLRAEGNRDIVRLDQSADAVLKEYEGVTTGNAGTLNVSDVDAARETYKHIQTTDAMDEWIKNARRILDNAKAANEDTRKQFRENLRAQFGLKTKSETAPSAPKITREQVDSAARKKGITDPSKLQELYKTYGV